MFRLAVLSYISYSSKVCGKHAIHKRRKATNVKCYIFLRERKKEDDFKRYTNTSEYQIYFECKILKIAK